MNIRMLLAGAASACVFSAMAATPAAATTYTFVGSWQVDDGPYWGGSPPNGPLAYTGQEAAAALFGGSASDYAISTAGSDGTSINFSAWYSVLGVNDGHVFAQDYSSKYLGQYYGPSNGFSVGDQYVLTNPASSYVDDNANGDTFTNYAFRISDDGAGPVPEPATWALMIFGFGMAGAVVRRRQTLRAA